MFISLNVIVYSLIVGIIYHTYNVEAVCGYQSCPRVKSNLINVHLVPHSHDDVGWLKTVDQYYYGSKANTQQAGVQYILDSVVEELMKDSNRRFIYVESAFFFKWWNEQSSDTQENVKKLVNNGQLEFSGGAWSMNDEAAAHYQSIIDQFTLGLKKLSNTFGTCGRPRVGWQIDPFGHSREMASIFAQMGYIGEFFARADWVEKYNRLYNLTAEMIWRASDDLGEDAEIFTGILYNFYSQPPGFCFDTLCGDEPIIDGYSYDNNVNERVNKFIEYINTMTTKYRSHHLLVPMGGDFNYQNADQNFKNMDKLIKYVNERQVTGSKVNVFYSTLSCYLNALHDEKLTWPTKTQDFFPYSSDSHTYWTGYFTSRPTQKRFERDGNHFLQVVKQLSTIANLTGADVDENLNKLRQAMGIMQHHDAISGTAKEVVASDYARLLTDGIVAGQINTKSALRKLTTLTNGEFENCLLLNISVCEFTKYDANDAVVTLYNPLAQISTQYVRIPVKNGNYEVRNAAGAIVASQLIVVPEQVLNLLFRPTDTQHELIFLATVDKIANYYIKRKETSSADTIVKNSLVKLTFGNSGHLENIEMNGVSENIRQDFLYYKSANGNNAEFKNRSSGAYIFRPIGTEIVVAQNVKIDIYEGSLVKEVHQNFNDWISQVIRIYEGFNSVEFEWLIGPIPIDDGLGKEVITRFTSSLKSNRIFWTDSNGREMIRRVRNERENFKPNLSEPVSGNYYPITARIAIEDDKKRFALLNDRAQGGSSITDGALELMLHRRLLHDDAFGVDEALNETQYGTGLVARGKIQLILDSIPQKPSVKERFAQLEVHLPFWKFFSNASRTTNEIPPELPTFTSLPVNIHLLTLEPFSSNEHLLRLENCLNKNETSTFTLLNLRKIFDYLGGIEIRETTLDGSMALNDMKRLKFQPDGSTVTNVENYTLKHEPLSAIRQDSSTKFDIIFEPMQIRTFIIRWK